MERLNRTTEQRSDLGEIIDEIDKTDVVVFEKLNASNDKAAKAEFLENPNLIHPNNEYGNLDESEVRRNIEELDLIERRLESSWMNDKEKRLAYMVLEDNRKKNEFLAANLAYNSASTPDEKAKMAEWHKEANINLYGEPDKNTFYALLEEKISDINPEQLATDEREIYDKLVDQIDIPEGAESRRFRPKPETIERFSELVKDFYGNFLKHIPAEQEKFSSEDAVRIVNEIINTEFGSDEVYHAIVDERVSNASAGHGVIKFPADAVYSKERLSALIVHELGTHAMRSIPYQSQEIKPFATSLPNREAFEEGIAGCMEQALKGEYEDFGVDHYINIGLATFADLNFREVYDFQMNLKKLKGEDTSRVLNAVQRCFRGTGELPNNKDLAYYNGVNRVWKYIEKHIDDPELFDSLLLSGKTDIENSEQESLVYEMRTKGGLS